MKKVYSFVWLVMWVGVFTALLLLALQKHEVKNWIEEPSDELMDFISK